MKKTREEQHAESFKLVELGLRPVEIVPGKSIFRLKMESLFKPEGVELDYNINALYIVESAVLCKRESLL
jgi:hypothetical protein